MPEHATTAAARNTSRTPASRGFVISAPRSGSTWLMRSLSAHPQVHATEHRLFGPYHDEVHDAGSDRPRLRITLDRFADAHARHLNLTGTGLDVAGARERVLRALAEGLFALDHELTGKPTVVDKITPNPGTADTVVARVRELFAGAPLVALVRDGRDMVTSVVHHWLTKRALGVHDPAHADERRRLVAGGRVGELGRFFDDDEIGVWASLWRECVRATRNADAEVRFEAMVRDQRAVLRMLLTSLGIDATERDLDVCIAGGRFEAASGGRPRGQLDPTADARAGVVGDWQRVFTRRDGEAFDTIAGDELVELGYAEPGWWRELPQDLSRCA